MSNNDKKQAKQQMARLPT